MGLGNPLLDISVAVSEPQWAALSAKYALKMGDACLAGDTHQPLYAEIVRDHADTVQYIEGGATQNTIRVAQWVSRAAPGFAAFVGSVGDDAFGRTLREAASADGVNALYEVQPAGAKPTGTCAVIVRDAERSLCANLAAAEAFSAAHLDTASVAAALSAARIFYTAGFPLTHDGGAAGALSLAKRAAADGKIYALNLSAPFLCQVRSGAGTWAGKGCTRANPTPPPSLPLQFFKDRLAGQLHYADFVFCNESEAAAWGAANGLGDAATVEAVALAIAALPKANAARARTVIVTQGAKETVIAEGGKTHSIPVEPVASIVDVNGAGDAFVGGFLAALAKDAPVDTAVRVGTWAAAHIIQRSGCSFDRAAVCPITF